MTNKHYQKIKRDSEKKYVGHLKIVLKKKEKKGKKRPETDSKILLKKEKKKASVLS